MQGPFWRDWGWRFGKPLQQYDSKKLYSLLHQRHPLSLVLNARWVSSNHEVRWIHQLHSVWSLHLSYKLWVFAWLVVYQGLPSKAHLAKSRLSDGLCPFCHELETLKHLLWDCSFARSCWRVVQDHHSVLLQDNFIGMQLFLGTLGPWFCPTSWEFGTVFRFQLCLQSGSCVASMFFLMRSVLSILFVTLGEKRYVCNCLPKVTSLLRMPKSSVL
jgi:hypothetical protein